MQSLGRVFEETPKFNQNFPYELLISNQIPYEFIIIICVCTCKCKAMAYTINVKHFSGNVCF